MAYQTDKSVRRNGIPSQRQLRVGEVLRKAMVEILDRVELRDPDIAGVSITVSEVSISPDLKTAMVFVMPLGGGARESVIAGLARAAPFLRGQIARRIQLRHVPRLLFSIDTAFDSSAYMNSLLRTLDSPEEELLEDGEEPPPSGKRNGESEDGA